MNRKVILLTGCINPGSMCFTSLKDSDIRRNQYIEAIKYYLENTKFSIVFCNNSGFDKELSDAVGGRNVKRLELLFFEGNNYRKEYGKGYGEYNIIKYAFQNSYLLKDADIIVKITGRLIVRNLSEVCFLNLFLFRRKTYVHLNNELKIDNFYDSRLIVAHKIFYYRYLEEENLINDSDGYFFEHNLYDKINNSHYRFIPFLIQPQIIGISGSHGAIYRSVSGKKSIRLFLHNCKDFLEQIFNRF